jgi:hypothetical protein
MKLTHEDLLRIRSAFSVCRSGGIEAVVISEGQIRGISVTGKAAIISKLGVSTGDTRIGVGRISDLEKRLGIFTGEILAEGTVNQNNDCSLLSIKAGRSSIQFRCTAEKFIKYPKSMSDDAVCSFSMSKSEVQQLARAVRTLGAEIITFQFKKTDKSIHIESTSATNETFKTVLEGSADFEGEAQNIVHTYEGNCLSTMLDSAARDADAVDAVLGEAGSLTIIINGHTMVMMPEANNEGEDDE